MYVRTATQSVSVKEGNAPFFFWIRKLRKAMSRMINRMMMSMMLKILKQWKTKIGLPTHLISANLSLLAQPLIAKRKILRIRIQRTGATSCIRRMEREEKAPKEVTLCCSLKAEKETPKEKASPREKEKENLARAKVIERAKDRKERTLVA
jgi:hypothetical protein